MTRERRRWFMCLFLRARQWISTQALALQNDEPGTLNGCTRSARLNGLHTHDLDSGVRRHLTFGTLKGRRPIIRLPTNAITNIPWAPMSNVFRSRLLVGALLLSG